MDWNCKKWITFGSLVLCLVNGSSVLSQTDPKPRDATNRSRVDVLVDGRGDLESDIEAKPMPNESQSNWNLPLPTLGGKQFWTDYRWWNGWRLQYSRTVNHWRLIDPSSIRRGWGTKEAMLAELNVVQHRASSTEEPTEVVILLHGLMRSATCMKPIAQEIDRRESQQVLREGGGAVEVPASTRVISFTYASTRDPITTHAEALRELVENLPGEPRLRFVGHSMGNIVLRLAISQWEKEGDPKGILPRFQRVVMLGPPNQGSAFAKQLSKLGLFATITGRSGMQLGPQWEDFQGHLGIPPCPFAIIAGDLSESTLRNPLLTGPSDGVVTVEEAKLEGMTEFETVPILHSFLMQDSECVNATVNFLYGGSIRVSSSDADRK